MTATATWRRRIEAAMSRTAARRGLGWIGVDVGSSSLKVAQVERTGAGWRLVAGRVLPLPAGMCIDAESLAKGLVGQLVQTVIQGEPGFRGRAVALSLPLSVAGLQSFDMPPATDAELRQMIGQEFVSAGTEGGDAREFAFWRPPQPANERTEATSPVTVLSVPRHVAGGVGEDLLRAKLHCRVLDGQPFALARAVQMASESDAHRPQAAVDWGYTSPLFTIVVNGRPVFARALRDRGLKQLLEALAKRLGLELEECRQLLIAYGQSHGAAGGETGISRDVLMQLVSQPVMEFAKEIQKTLQYLKQQPAALLPTRLWLFGGGGVLRHGAEQIGAVIGMETRVWQLGPQAPRAAGGVPSLHALLGPAMALSALGAPS